MLGIDKSTMSLILNGKRKLPLDKAADIARLLGVTPSEVMQHMGVRVDGIKTGGPETVQTLPFEGWIDATARVHKDSARRKRPLNVGFSVEPGSVAFQWRTPQTKMDILDGWIVVAGARREADEGMIGRGCVVGTKDGEVMIRAVRRGYSQGRYSLLGLDMPDVEDVEVVWYAPVLFMKPATT